ncbi:MAG: MerR family DNA-binding transcriptional regulator [Clostridiales Family XIII bacterium]|nr:MerR family DNA-binding transcriptional regulator [Clostridiales Family XIII bacterium]
MKETDLLSMKKFSEFSGISQSTLRYYDRIGLFSPIARGENDYRLYSPRQIILINLINVLTDLGVPLKTIHGVVNDRTPEKILETLAVQERLLDAQLHHIQEAYSTIHTLRETIWLGNASNEFEISDVMFDELPLIEGALNDFENESEFYKPFMRFCKEAKNMGVNLNYPIGGYFENMEAFVTAPSQPTRFFSLDPQGRQSRVAGRYIVGYVRGYYGEMGDTGKRLVEYAKANKLAFTGPLYVIYLHDEISIKDTEKYLAQISVSVKPLGKG